MAYWQEVHQEALEETIAWLRQRPEVTVGSVVIAIVGIIVIWNLGSKDGTWDEILKALSTAVIVLAVPFVYGWNFFAIPPRKHADQQRQIDEATKRLAAAEAAQEPSVKFDPSETDGALFASDKKRPGGADFALGLLPVRNCSTLESVDARVTLISYQGKGGRLETVRKLLPSNSLNAVSAPMPAQASDHFRLVRIPQANNRAFLAPSGDRGELGGIHIEPGIYRLHAQAAGSRGLPDTRFYRLEVSTAGRHKLHPWPEGEPWE